MEQLRAHFGENSLCGFPNDLEIAQRCVLIDHIAQEGFLAHTNTVRDARTPFADVMQVQKLARHSGTAS
ncbi:MAG: hypothetical protein NT090_20445 [Acidobacteria bacterium]|nr:hypothetical protein [Acidobacteriota bacterium]